MSLPPRYEGATRRTGIRWVFCQPCLEGYHHLCLSMMTKCDCNGDCRSKDATP